MGMTPQYFHTILTSCAILPPQNSLHAYLPVHNLFHTQINKALHGLPLQDNSYLPCSATIHIVYPRHNSHFDMTTDLALLMHSTASAYKADHICHDLYSNVVAATHNISMQDNPPMHTTNKHKA